MKHFFKDTNDCKSIHYFKFNSVDAHTTNKTETSKSDQRILTIRSGKIHG